MKTGNVFFLFFLIFVSYLAWRMYQGYQATAGIRTVRNIDPSPAPVTLQNVNENIPLEPITYPDGVIQQ